MHEIIVISGSILLIFASPVSLRDKKKLSRKAREGRKGYSSHSPEHQSHSPVYLLSDFSVHIKIME